MMFCGVFVPTFVNVFKTLVFHEFSMESFYVLHLKEDLILIFFLLIASFFIVVYEQLDEIRKDL